MIIGVTYAEYISGYKLKITFDNNVSKIVDLSASLNGKIFLPLKSIDYFKQFKVNKEIETITWSNGADFSPEFLYEIGETWN